MDIGRFVDSAAIRAYLKEQNYPFSAQEAAFLAYQCKTASLEERVPGQWFLPLNQVVEYAGRLLKEANSQEVFTGGAKEFLRFPEYRDADKAT